MEKVVRFSEDQNTYYNEDPALSEDLHAAQENNHLTFKNDIIMRYSWIIGPVLEENHREKIRFYIANHYKNELSQSIEDSPFLFPIDAAAPMDFMDITPSECITFLVKLRDLIVDTERQIKLLMLRNKPNQEHSSLPQICTKENDAIVIKQLLLNIKQMLIDFTKGFAGCMITNNDTM